MCVSGHAFSLFKDLLLTVALLNKKKNLNNKMKNFHAANWKV